MGIQGCLLLAYTLYGCAFNIYLWWHLKTNKILFTMILDLDVCMDRSRMTDDSSINVEQSTL